MKKSDRAKIFGSFSPLKGFYEEILKKEKIVVPKAELLEDREAEIDLMLRQIKIGDIVCAVHYFDGEYIKTIGCVSRLDTQGRALYLAKTKIEFDSIYNLYFAE